jgi:hypothetical protein
MKFLTGCDNPVKIIRYGERYIDSHEPIEPADFAIVNLGGHALIDSLQPGIDLILEARSRLNGSGNQFNVIRRPHGLTGDKVFFFNIVSGCKQKGDCGAGQD